VTSKTAAYAPSEDLTSKWDSGDLGRSMEHAAVASDAVSDEVDYSLELQPVSIRLQRSLIEKLKLIAGYRKVAYQPLVRDLLNRFADSELKDIIHELSAPSRHNAAEEDPIVNGFMEREQLRKQA
jgi:hypothetical protein